ncbi:MAG: glutamine synthetase type III, partial [Clostridia bacterium]|nr:glutamine synthetase type III [Clostridia bacterium]
YSDEWVREAERRGLKNLKTTVDALSEYTSEKNIALFTRNGILSESEMVSRREVMLENYAKVVNIEAHTLADMVNRDILPAIIRYTNVLSDKLCDKKALGIAAKAENGLLKELSSLADSIWEEVNHLNSEINKASDGGVTSQSAKAFSTNVLTSMLALRRIVDKAEALTDSKLWPYPSYGELLSSVHE